ncbi:MAG: protein tyrosine phosphatase [Hydrogenophilales bacterium CG_4_10_14_3_um_filter_58_23]|nr:MAG: protein tyrosine phosphatase [Zetaproteobacteria bacterium CG23_combo_of_CG06-09_8_20_14_all_54_7]PIQ13034.1 MAG: protein tyrosine phosphatase [Hydrogenophilales bacterium CG18_big_fil_WC_8_21_14_2_50_58_12]PIX99621.1 MAG: protein tyrosine phosphatase [Hydrogenophilales bacterium CG_4_10_14_3_um_filter_58_23]
MIHNILVICIGNICRSPIAEGLLKRALPEKRVYSAGIGAMIGYPADPFAVQLMQELGIDISAHRAQSLASWMVSEADIILTMDQEQKRFIEQKYSTSKGKVFRLGEFSKYDIPDPYQQDLAVFRQTYTLIAQGVDALIERIAHIN